MANPLQRNPIAIGLLLYLCFFQLTVYRHALDQQCDENHLSSKSRQSTTTRKKLAPQRWRRFSNETVRVPYPIFLTSLPKSGTTSLWKFFQCGGVLASHQYVKRHPNEKPSATGRCIQDNIWAGRPPFYHCGKYDVYTDTGFLVYSHRGGERCFYPSIDGLNELYESYPTMTFVNVVRNASDWFTSLVNWSNGSLFTRFRLCNMTGNPGGIGNENDFIEFYQWQNDRVRAFVKEHPSLTYIEVELESPETGRILSEATGIEASCWRKCRPQTTECNETETRASTSHS